MPTALPVKSIRLDTKIRGQVAITHVEQIFRNDTPYTLEGTYFFPIPENASIVEFAIWENGKKLVGEVRSREEARRIYDEIVRRQRDPGLLEYAGKDLFQASIFPIPPNSDKKLELRYTQALKGESGTVEYRYPLGTGRNIWNREQAHADLTMSPAGQKFGSVSGKIEIVGDRDIRNVYSPTHVIETVRRGGSTTVTFESSGSGSDLQLFYGVSDKDFGLSLITYREPGKDGYFMLTLSPRDETSERELVNKDIVFVLDTSGSMAEEGKMEKARAALLFGVRTLRDGDRFNVISFAGEERLMESGLIDADAAGRKRAEEFIQKLTPSGGTNINDALVRSIKQFENGSQPRMLVFMTDGLPTVGERDAAKIIENARSARSVEVRIFPFGFGYDVNTALLDRLGSENAGVSDYVQPQEDIEVKVSNFFARVSSPVLSDIDIDLGKLQTDTVYPRKAIDLFRGMQTVLIGRYKNDSDLRDVTVTLKGRTGKEEKNFAFRGLNFPVRAEDNDFLPRLWASRRVGWLIEQIRLNGEAKELRDEVIDLGLRYGLVTPYTSYLATDGSVANAADSTRRAGIAMAAPAKMAERSGAGAVRMSVQQNALQTNTMIVENEKKEARDRILVDNTANYQFFAGKNFVKQNDVWVDSDAKPGRNSNEVVLRFGSEEYLQLAAADARLARYFSLGEQVIVVWKGAVYKIVK